MYKSEAEIRKVGNKYCVFSKNGKNMGCSDTRQGAQKRLQQVEFFKHKGSADMSYSDAFKNVARALNQGFTPEEVGAAPDATPNNIKVESETLSVSDSLRTGTIAGSPSDKLLDKKEHFPVITQTQAQSSMARVMQLTDTPVWYNGTLAQLRQEVHAGIMKLHPDIQLNVRVPAEMVVALSDGEESAETSTSTIKDPNSDRKRKHVPQVSRPTLTSAEVQEALQDEEARKAVAGRLMELLDAQMGALESAKQIVARLTSDGLKAEEFEQLNTQLQEGVLRELLSRNTSANTHDRRQELLDRMKNG